MRYPDNIEIIFERAPAASKEELRAALDEYMVKFSLSPDPDLETRLTSSYQYPTMHDRVFDMSTHHQPVDNPGILNNPRPPVVPSPVALELYTPAIIAQMVSIIRQFGICVTRLTEAGLIVIDTTIVPINSRSEMADNDFERAPIGEVETPNLAVHSTSSVEPYESA